jgi:(4-(4-[2-(gamma-L-glutamylamino)ethyl]phenoxymethyl)furan-2-yl)methanamine synthase
MADTADGKGKTMLESARRLARMIGYDVEDKSLKIGKI